ncbi:hypothetical protein Egran_06063 [Elaphomyces granulatus]|uniref:MULE transposase domain-containing protein n=1 Tax=Elaphomyces granulatus TaxID=519963 RepID=A0A232LPV8_9EURO|nr:hypothetical protein Egran_06063 [Elaphomyces granulatus]
MSFKRIAGDIKEIAFATMDETIGSILVLARVFVNSDTQKMYEYLFQNIFPLIEETSGAAVRWQHIHGSGIEAVLVDMCHKQASGLGHYLTSLDPSITWRDHLHHTLIFCLVHFRRGIEQKFRNADCYRLMLQLPTATKDACKKILDTLSRHRLAAVREWAKHKETSWILAGINPHFTKMDQNRFRSYQKDTNLIESTHHMTNVSGIGVSLLAGIHHSQKIDSERVESVEQFLVSGVRPRSKVTSSIKRKERVIAGAGKRLDADEIDLRANQIKGNIEVVDLTQPTSPREKRHKRSGIFSSSGINQTPVTLDAPGRTQLGVDFEQERMKLDYEFELKKLELESKFRERGLEM